MAHRVPRPWPVVLLSSLCLLGMILSAGCRQSNIGKVAGRVTIGHRPLGQGAIVFQDSATGAAVITPLSSDGTYCVKTYKDGGLAPGDYRVAFQPHSSYRGPGPFLVKPRQKKPEPQNGPEKWPVPEKYLAAATSGLKVTVKQGDNPPFDFDLTPR